MPLHLYADSRLTSPYAMSVFVTLTEKRLPFTMQALDLAAGAHQAGSYARTSLTQRVPTLVDGDFHLSESSAITEYLEETQPQPPVYPAELRARARARQVQAWLRSDFMPIREERSTEGVFFTPVTTPLSAAARSAADKLFAAASALLSHGGDHLFGDWCIADTDLALMLNRLLQQGDEVPAHLAAYTRRQWARPSVQAWVQMKRPMD